MSAEGYGLLDSSRDPLLRSRKKLNCLRASLTISILIAILASVGCIVFGVLYSKQKKLDDYISSWPSTSFSKLGIYYEAAAAADHQDCSNIGKEILARGGNAVDSAIAVVVCLGVTDPRSTGIGGGHQMVIFNSTSKQCTGIDARETAPAAATQRMYVDGVSSTYGYTSIAVPGTIHGLYHAWQRYGSIPWMDLLMPTVRYIRNGVPVSANTAKNIANLETMINDPDTHMNIYRNNETGRSFMAGEIIRQGYLPLARTIEAIALASDPIDEFYGSGWVARAIINDFTEHDSFITADDMRNYKSLFRSKDQMIYANVKDEFIACGLPPPSSAAVTLSIVGILQARGEKMASQDTIDRFYHEFVEASKFAYAGHAQLGDVDFVANATEIARYLTSAEYTHRAAELVQSNSYKNSTAYYRPLVEKYGADKIDVGMAHKTDHGTTHATIVDGWGNAVSVTATINLSFGSKMRDPVTGIVWNDEMDDFSSPGLNNDFGYRPARSNFIQPGKRPQSSMAPIVAFDRSGKVHFAIGAAGGSRIISGTAYALSRQLWLDEGIKDAIDAPRLHNQLNPFYTKIEKTMPQPIYNGLIARGHHLRTVNKIGNVVTGISLTLCADFQGLYCQNSTRMDEFVWTANTDWRKGTESSSDGF